MYVCAKRTDPLTYTSIDSTAILLIDCFALHRSIATQYIARVGYLSLYEIKSALATTLPSSHRPVIAGV
jgi:hypothetical protein